MVQIIRARLAVFFPQMQRQPVASSSKSTVTRVVTRWACNRKGKEGTCEHD
jgi:hypothetical protein